MSNRNGNNNAGRAPPALNPEQPALTQPYKDWVSRGLISKLLVRWTPIGTTISGTLSDHVQLSNYTGAREDLPIGTIKELLNQAGYGKGKESKKNGGDGAKKEEPLPVRSLCGRDAKDPDSLPARLLSVAKAVGSTSACGRIASLSLSIEGAATFEKWWELADPSQKIRLFTTDKYYKSLSDEETSVILGSIKEMNCPFRGPLPTPNTKEEKKETKKDEKKGEVNRVPTPSKGANGKPAVKKS